MFLKTCNFNIQIIIQSKKEDLSQSFDILNQISQKEKNNKIKQIIKEYYNFIKIKNEESRSSSKNFYIIIKYNINTKDVNEKEIDETIAINFLNECFFKIKESLSRCGNIVFDINSKKEVQEILKSFLDSQLQKK